MEEFDLNQLIHLLPDYFQPDRAAGLDVTVQVTLIGEKGGDWFVEIQNQTCKVNDGIHDNPTLAIEATADDVLEILYGNLDPMIAFMTGRLRLKGDRAKALKLITLFKIDALPF